jgi:hypothetical protein
MAKISNNHRFPHHRGKVDSIITETTKHKANLDPDEVPNFHGLRLSTGLKMFATEVARINPRFCFGVNSFTRARWNGGIRELYELWVYLPEQPYALMRIGYNDYQEANSDYLFSVASRLIVNNKYSDNNDGYWMALTTDLGRAVKNVKTYMRPYSVDEMMRINFDDFAGQVHTEKRELSNEEYTLRRQIKDHDALMAELSALANSDYKFINDSLRTMILQYEVKRIETQTLQQRAKHGWFVNVTTRMGAQQFDVVELFDVHNTRQHSTPRTGETKTYTEETLPEEISGKMAALMMIELEARVADVGKRVSSTMFFVERE